MIRSIDELYKNARVNHEGDKLKQEKREGVNQPFLFYSGVAEAAKSSTLLTMVNNLMMISLTKSAAWGSINRSTNMVSSRLKAPENAFIMLFFAHYMNKGGR